jgi:predicted CxxxxCH...CXXCH cytochrome family protein
VRGKVISDGVDCESCHPVPATVGEHANGGPAVVVLRDPVGTPAGDYTARSGNTAAKCSNTYCHGNFVGGNAGNTPAWSDVGTQSACSTCHGFSPKTGKHPSNFSQHAWMGTKCQYCHFDVAGDGVIKNRQMHVDGQVTVTVTNYEGTAPSGTYSKGSCAPGCHDTVLLPNPQLW